MHFWQVPPAHWPWRWHIAMGASVVGAAGAAAVMAWTAHQNLQHRARQVSIAKERMAHEPLASKKPDGADVFWASLPPPGTAEAVTRDIAQAAAREGVAVQSLAISITPGTPTDLGVVLIDLRATGGYAPIKAWLSHLLARYPTLAVRHLTLRGSANTGNHEAHAVFALFVKD